MLKPFHCTVCRKRFKNGRGILPYICRPCEKKQTPAAGTKDIAAKRERFFKALWRHPWAHEGLKCKTCLPIEAAEQAFDEVFKDDLPEPTNLPSALKYRITDVKNRPTKSSTTKGRIAWYTPEMLGLTDDKGAE